MISFAAHKLLSVVGEVDPEKEIGSESETALEITEEIESETEVVIEKERGKSIKVVQCLQTSAAEMESLSSK